MFSGDFFHEVVLRLNRPAHKVLDLMAGHRMLAGYSLDQDYPKLENTLLICATETKTEQDLQRYATIFRKAMQLN